MSKRWHYSTQSKADAPVDSSQLRRLARRGVLKPDDLVRKQGSRRWVKAKRIEGLFGSKPKWSYQHHGLTYGPVTDHQLRSLATAGMIEPDDLVWREGLGTWIEARRLRGLFPCHVETTAKVAAATAVARKATPNTSRMLRISALALMASLATVGVAGILRREPSRPPIVHQVGGRQPQATEATVVESPEEVTSDKIEPLAPSIAAAKPAVAMDEATIGRLIHERFMQGRRTFDDPQLLADVRASAEPLLKGRDRKDVEYRFTILDSDEVDAFSHLGGYVYLTRGLFSLVADEAELGFVIGHEIAHIDLRHGSLVGEQVDMLAASVTSPRPEDDEYAADRWARQRLGDAGYADFEALSFLRRFRNYCDRKAAEPTGAAHRPGADAASHSHWTTAPSPTSRLERLQGPAA